MWVLRVRWRWRWRWMPCWAGPSWLFARDRPSRHLAGPADLCHRRCLEWAVRSAGIPPRRGSRRSARSDRALRRARLGTSVPCFPWAGSRSCWSASWPGRWSPCVRCTTTLLPSQIPCGPVTSPPRARRSRASSAAIPQRSTRPASRARRSRASPRIHPTASSHPVFWGALFGLPGILGYKAINTLDSMIGHRSERHEAFGWAAARIDDVANFIPRAADRMSVRAAGATAIRGAVVHDAGCTPHRSPNAGWPEAAMAGRAWCSAQRSADLHGNTTERAMAE